jgi:transposase
LTQRVRIILLAADGLSNTEIAEKVGTTCTTVIAWRVRYTDARVESLRYHDWWGQARRIAHRTIVAAAPRPPKKLGITHWSSRLLATSGDDRPQHRGESLAGLRGRTVADRHL